MQEMLIYNSPSRLAIYHSERGINFHFSQSPCSKPNPDRLGSSPIVSFSEHINHNRSGTISLKHFCCHLSISIHTSMQDSVGRNPSIPSRQCMDEIKLLYTEVTSEMSPRIHDVIAERAERLLSRAV